MASYIERSLPVLGRPDMDKFRRDAESQAEQRGVMPVDVELHIACSEHPSTGSRAVYEDGLLILACLACGALIGQYELASHAREWTDTESQGLLN